MAEQSLVLPKGYRIEFGGEEEERGEAVGSIVSTFTLYLWLMIAVIVLSLNSFRYAGIIGITGILSVGLAFFGVWLSGYPMGYMESFNIDNSGVVTGVYSNGTKQILAQVASSVFTNPQGLIAAGENLFEVSNNSGLANIGPAGNAGRGKIVAGGGGGNFLGKKSTPPPPNLILVMLEDAEIFRKT